MEGDIVTADELRSAVQTEMQIMLGAKLSPVLSRLSDELSALKVAQKETVVSANAITQQMHGDMEGFRSDQFQIHRRMSNDLEGGNFASFATAAAGPNSIRTTEFSAWNGSGSTTWIFFDR